MGNEQVSSLAVVLHELGIGLHDAGGYCSGPEMHEGDATELEQHGVMLALGADGFPLKDNLYLDRSFLRRMSEMARAHTDRLDAALAKDSI